MNYELLKVGTDAEFFLRNKNGSPVPVVGLLGGTKENPKPVPELGEGFAVQEDNVMPEVNIPAAADSASFVRDCGLIIAHLTNEMSRRDLVLDISGSAFFVPDLLQSLQAQTFGCQPDLNAHLRGENVIDRDNVLLVKHGLRTAAAHVHLSFNVDGKAPPKGDNLIREPIVMMCDFAYGLPSVLLDEDTLRRQLYGKAGSFRSKDYGIESRVMSNWWLRSPEYIKWVFDQAEWMMFNANNWLERGWLEKGTTSSLADIINRHDKMMAWRWINDFDIPMPKSFFSSKEHADLTAKPGSKKSITAQAMDNLVRAPQLRRPAALRPVGGIEMLRMQANAQQVVMDDIQLDGQARDAR